MTTRYETLMLARPDVTQEEASNLEKQLSAVVTKGEGKVLSFEKWGKYKLSYPVKKNQYGIYMLARFELPKGAATEILKELQLFFKIKVNDTVLRHVSKKLASDAPLAYKRPESADAGARPYSRPERREEREEVPARREEPVAEPKEEAKEEPKEEPTPEA